VVPTPRRWRQVLRSCVGPTGLRQNHIRRRRWQNSPVTEESTKETVKTIACGNAGRSGVLVVTRVRSLPTQSAREAAGAVGTRHSPRPLLGRKINARLGRIASRGANVCLELTVIASAERRADFGPVHSRITALRIPRRRLRTVFAAGMAPTFIDRGHRGGGCAKGPKPELLNKLNHASVDDHAAPGR
jgi:hypothetical protein